MSISAAQCRAARALLDLSQSDVAESAHLSAPTVGAFERHGKAPSHNNLQAIRTALEAAGILFVPANKGGTGVRLRDPRNREAPGKTELSPDLCRAARNLLDLSQLDLAEAAGVGRSTVSDYERGARRPTSANLTVLRASLEAAGVTFIEADEAAGPGVRLRK